MREKKEMERRERNRRGKKEIERGERRMREQ